MDRGLRVWSCFCPFTSSIIPILHFLLLSTSPFLPLVFEMLSRVDIVQGVHFYFCLTYPNQPTLPPRVLKARSLLANVRFSLSPSTSTKCPTFRPPSVCTRSSFYLFSVALNTFFSPFSQSHNTKRSAFFFFVSPLFQVSNSSLCVMLEKNAQHPYTPR